MLPLSWLRRLVAGLFLCSPGFNPSQVRVEFVIDKVALGHLECLHSNVEYVFSDLSVKLYGLIVGSVSVAKQHT